ncbi:hypothetical protein [Salipiger mucosus]|uniref:Uncharacterized protein n=1 Tax=Salipiger mucosus DSM 16094 TaxID=1123237 RepID=S9RVV0_9RHOB|nr:hypothetical protein [Salipiger mucosus]EPX82120.1 hypothetical protein Salmuc_02489 [Salipiger mucosus DSM 16094]
MIDLTAPQRAKLYLAMRDALDVTDEPQDRHAARRLALCELVSKFTGDDGAFALHEAFRLADALDHHLTEHANGPEFGFSVANVARLVGGDRDTAKAALRLLGACPTFDAEGPDDWATAPREMVESIRFPRDALAAQVRLELEEAEAFAA